MGLRGATGRVRVIPDKRPYDPDIIDLPENIDFRAWFGRAFDIDGYPPYDMLDSSREGSPLSVHSDESMTLGSDDSFTPSEGSDAEGGDAAGGDGDPMELD